MDKECADKFFPAPHAAKERSHFRETIELKIIRGRDRDVAWVAQDVDQAFAGSSGGTPSSAQLMM
jgi:hypothetical protein